MVSSGLGPGLDGKQAGTLGRTGDNGIKLRESDPIVGVMSFRLERSGRRNPWSRLVNGPVTGKNFALDRMVLGAPARIPRCASE